jgi:hypothetical protein
MSLFDATNVSTTGVEDGEHIASIASAEVKQTKSGTGEYINVKWELENGASFFMMYTIKNPNQQAVNIGLGALKNMLKAAGAPSLAPAGVEELIGLRCLLKVKNKTDDYGDKVTITSYKKAPEANPFG